MATIASKKLPMPSEDNVEPIQGTAIVVIHPGSYNLRIGRSVDPFPQSIPHVIARRAKSSNAPMQNEILVPAPKMDSETEALFETARCSISDVLKTCLTSTGRRRYSTDPNKLVEANRRNSSVNVPSDMSWTSADASKDYFIGDEALYLKPESNFFLHWPIKRGQLNIHAGIGGSLASILSDLAVIWGDAITNLLDIPLKDLKHYRCVLIVPDIYNRHHVKELVSVLLDHLGFAACFVQQESVCATFGAGLSYACVVDVGDQKTSISCVEDGMSHLNSRLYMNYGGSDITRIFHLLLKKCGFPHTKCSPDLNIMDSLLLHELKENNCDVDLDLCGPQIRSFQVRSSNKTTKEYTMQIGDELHIAPLSFFQPEVLFCTGKKIIRTFLWSRKSVSEDSKDDEYLIQTQRRGAFKENVDANNQSSDTIGSQLEDSQLGPDEDSIIDPIDPTPTQICTGNLKEQDKAIEAEYEQLLSIDQAILQSVDRCGSDEMKKKMYSSILIVGGGMMFAGIDTWLQNRLIMQIPLLYRSEQMDIITKPKDMDPRFTAWKGGAVMSLLDSAQELWIKQKEWQKYNVKLLRERAPFLW